MYKGRKFLIDTWLSYRGGQITDTENRTKAKALVVVFVVFVFIFAILYSDPYGSKPSTPGLTADLWCYSSLLWFESWGREGLIHIRGWVINDGPRDVNVTVNLWVYDGTKQGGFSHGPTYCEYWESFYVPMGVIPANGGRKWLEWDRRYNPFDPTTVNFYFELIPEHCVHRGP